MNDAATPPLRAGPGPGTTDAELESLVPRPVAPDGEIHALAELFHERTKYHRASFGGQGLRISRFLTRPALIAQAAAGYRDFPHLEPIELPEPPAFAAELGAVLRGRQSCRTFSGPLALEQLSALLYHAVRCHRTAATAAVPGLQMAFRPYPSAGNLNALEFYLFLHEVSGVSPCVAHYDGRQHRLRRIRPIQGNPLVRADTAGEAGAVTAAAAIVAAMLPRRLTAKYGERGYRFALLEAGHAAQNLSLVAEGLGLGSLVHGSFYDDELAAAVGIDGIDETIATVVLVGPRAAGPRS